MISKNVENMIPKIQQFFGSQPIKKAWLFGSCSRGEESMDSDVDILVEYDRQNSRVSLMKIAAMMLNLEDLLHRKVDMVEASRLLPFALDSVNNDKFLIYERKSKSIIHGYYTVDPESLWDTIECDIPELKPWIEKYLQEQPE